MKLHVEIYILKPNPNWKALQHVLRNNIPDFVLNVLEASGYDTTTALLDINEAEIRIIESFAQENLVELIQGNSVYSRLATDFKFLPGHFRAVLAIPNLVKEFLATKQKPTPIARSQLLGPRLGQLPTITIETTSETTGKETVEEIEVPVQTLGKISEDKAVSLKKQLVSKIEKFVKKILCEKEFVFPEQNIGDFTFSLNKSCEIVYKCLVICVKCKSETSCCFNKLWQISNYEKHLKKCFLKATPAKQPSLSGPEQKNTDKDNQKKRRDISDETTPSIVASPLKANEADLSALMDETDENSNDLGKILNTIYVPINESMKNMLLGEK